MVTPVHTKIVQVRHMVKDGYDLDEVRPADQGRVEVRLRRDNEVRCVAFDHYEVPALLQECTEVGLAK